MQDIPFATESGDSLVNAWDRVEVHVPEEYFEDPPLAQDLGTRVETLAFVTIHATRDPGGRPERFSLSVPAVVAFGYTERSEVRATEAEGGSYRIFASGRGDVLVADLHIIQSSDNMIQLFRVLSAARITNVRYENLAKLIIDGGRLNGAKTGVSASMLEAMVSELARWKGDPLLPLRIPLAAGKAGPEDFELIKLKELPRIQSVFTGLGFEDVQLAVQSGVRKTVTGAPQQVSPIEEVMKY